MRLDPKVASLIGELDFDPDALYARYAAERDKRLRPDGVEQYKDAASDIAECVDDPYVQPGFSREAVFDHVQCAVIGGGFGGLLMAARLKLAGVSDVRVIEVAGDFGGTWYWNRYPGVMCDVESYIYLPLLEELGYMPKHKYALGAEIFEHCKRVARHFNLYEKAMLQTSVTEARWDDEAGNWIVRTNRGDRFTAQFVAIANGPLSKPKLPGIPGIRDFKGHIFHTSRWDYNYTGGDSSGGLTGLADKRVGIVGTGATAIQCVPQVGKWAKELYVFQRTPSSVDVRNNRETDQEWFRSQPSGWQKRRMENFNNLVSGVDQDEDLIHDGWTDIARRIGGAARQAEKQIGRTLTPEERDELTRLADYRKMNEIRSRVDSIIKDPATAEALKPWYRQFCKRPCFHDEYLQTFARPNVKLVDTNGQGIERMTRNAVVVDGKEYPVDCLIFATGFEVGTSYAKRAGYDVIGRSGQLLTEHWAQGPRTLHGLTSHGFPNCIFLGSTQTANSNNLQHLLFEQTQHAAYLVAQTLALGHNVMEATKEAEEQWVHDIRTLPRSFRLTDSFFAECTPGYYNSEGTAKNPNGFYAQIYGPGPVKFYELLANWRATGSMPGIAFPKRSTKETSQ